MNLGDIEVRAALYALDALVRNRNLCGAGVPEAVRRLHARIRHVAEFGEPEDALPADDTEIRSAQAAEILGYTERYVRMIARNLDGRRVGRLWVFSRATVLAYAAARDVA
ncbi:hypothetical protein [Nocardia aurea]|uniref:hypothetical protein n=1 Tax=Nocardia aurea TaxID=2144174 RepID=UPI0033B25BF7